jgi:hypothetical protein
VVQPFREAGLPEPLADSDGEHTRYTGEIGVVRKTYPDLWRVDIEPQDGGLIHKAQVDGHTLPEVHIDVERPSYVEYWCRGGNLQDIWCSPIHWRRLKGPESATEPERRLYHKHLKIQRVGDITSRITMDNRHYITDAESGDIAMYSQPARTFHFLAPHSFSGTDEANRVELHTEGKLTDQLRVVIPQALIGATGQRDADGITYVQNELLHFVSNLIKLTANRIVLDPVDIRLGSDNATERAILGNLYQAFYNAFVALFNAHQHGNVQPGAGTTGPPTTPTPMMDDTMLSDVVHISKTGS